MKKILIVLLIMSRMPAIAQTWSMDSCISYALTHSNDLRRACIDRQQSGDDVKTSRLDFLPTVQGQVSGQYAWGRNIDPETNTYNTITTFNNYYTVEASIALFDGGQTINAFHRAKNARAQAETTLQKAGDDKAIAVMTKFVDAVYTQKSVVLAEEKLNDSQALLHKTRRLFELGERSRPDVVQVESQVAEDDYSLLHQKNQAHLALLALKAEMNYPTTDTLCLAGCEPGILPLTTGQLLAENSKLLSNDATPHGPHNVEIAEQHAEDLKYAWKLRRADLLPRLTLGGGLQTSYYRNISQGRGTANGFGSQFRNNLGEYVYLSLSIPIFTPSRWRSARRAKSEWQKALLDVDDARRKLNDDFAQATADCNGYRSEVAQMEKKVDADSLAYYLSRRKYEEGMLSTFDLHAASQTLLQSRIKLLQMQLLYAMKQRLVAYYEGQPLFRAEITTLLSFNKYANR